MVSGSINGVTLYQYDFTNAQYNALVKLTAVICLLFPNITCDYPKGPDGHVYLLSLSAASPLNNNNAKPKQVLNRTMTTEEYTAYHGLIGHYHLTNLKVI